jgi:hypothetical protein
MNCTTGTRENHRPVDIAVAVTQDNGNSNVRSNLLPSLSSPPMTLENLLFAAYVQYEPQLFNSNTVPTRTTTNSSNSSSNSNSNTNNDTDTVVTDEETVSCSKKRSRIEHNNNFQSVHGNEITQMSFKRYRRHQHQQDVCSIITTALEIAEQKI